MAGLVVLACGGPKQSPSAEIQGAAAAGSARAALLAAEAAGSTWMHDAALIYVENDSPIDAQGRSRTWGFLFHSSLAGAWRNVAVREGRVVHEGPLDFPFAAPDLPAAWIDSEAAVAAAEPAGGREFCDRTGAVLAHVVLGRGVFTGWDGPATWMVVYRSPAQEELAIVIRADDGSVLTRFEG